MTKSKAQGPWLWPGICPQLYFISSTSGLQPGLLSQQPQLSPGPASEFRLQLSAVPSNHPSLSHLVAKKPQNPLSLDPALISVPTSYFFCISFAVPTLCFLL